MKKTILLFALVFSLLFASACAETANQTGQPDAGDFILMEDLCWENTATEVLDAFGDLPADVENEGNGRVYVAYQQLYHSSIDGTVDLEFDFMEDGNKLTMTVATVNVNKPLLDLHGKMKSTYDMIAELGNQLYAGRSTVLADSVEKLMDIMANAEAVSPVERAVLEGVKNIPDVYSQETFDILTDINIWLVDGRSAVILFYSGTAVDDNKIYILSMNIMGMVEQDNFVNILQASGLDLPDHISGTCFGLPEGIQWSADRQTVLDWMGSAYIGEENGEIYALLEGSEHTDRFGRDCRFRFDAGPAAGVYLHGRKY